MTKVQSPLIGGKAIETWDGLTHRQPQLRPQVGLYRILLDGQVVAIGSGTDKKLGVEKRLYDLRRPGDSSRNHHSGRLINANIPVLEVQVLLLGQGPEAIELAKKLTKLMIERHKPAWTAPAPSPQTLKRRRKSKPRRAGGGIKPAPYTGTVPKG